jgi:hypothetical protein
MVELVYSVENLVNAGIVCVSLLVLFVIFQHLNISIARSGEAPIRWSWIPFLGFALEMGNRPIELLQESGALIGEIFGLVVAGNRMFIINDPHSYNAVLKPIKELSFVEFHHAVLTNFFGVDMKLFDSGKINEGITRKGFSQHLLRYVCFPHVSLFIH